jgi:hypothetical protein
MAGSKCCVKPTGSWYGFSARLGIDDEAVLAHVRRIGEAFLRQRQLRGSRTSCSAPRPADAPCGIDVPCGCSSTLPQLAVLSRAPSLVQPDVLVDRFECRIDAPATTRTRPKIPTAPNGQQRQAADSTSAIDASRYSLRNLSHTPNKLSRQDGDCVRAQARCKYFRTTMAALPWR